MSCGINRVTGKPLSGWPHVRQSIAVILTTRLGEMVLCRAFGFGGAGLLGKNLTPQAIMTWFMLIVLALSARKNWLLELGEPRFRVTSLTAPTDKNSPSQLQQGQIGLLVTGEYMPNALEGDFTVASQQKFLI